MGENSVEAFCVLIASYMGHPVKAECIDNRHADDFSICKGGDRSQRALDLSQLTINPPLYKGGYNF